MREIKSKNLTRLLMQLKFTPVEKRRSQLKQAQQLLDIIEPEQNYPFEFVFFRITGFRPKHEIEWETLNGQQLIDDLNIFISRLSSQVAEPVEAQKEKVYTIEQIAKSLNVSTKTVQRWRKKGLTAKKFIFPDGRKKLGFAVSEIEEFKKKNPHLTKQAQSFERMNEQEKQRILQQARKLSQTTNLSEYRIIKQVEKTTGRAHETIRYTIREYDKHNPDAPVFGDCSGALSPNQAHQLYLLYKQGTHVKGLMRKFNRSKSSVYRLINQQRAKALLAEKIEFITSNEFLHSNAKQKILSKPLKLPERILHRKPENLKLNGRSLNDYLQALKNVTLLTRRQEADFFRRYNFLKYLAAIERAGIKPNKVKSKTLKRIEGYLNQAQQIRQAIIEANLRLVVSIAGKHTHSGANMLDLISEGNVALMNSIEKFDYTRGVRFASYASWAIAKDFARKIPAETGRPDKAQSPVLDDVQYDLRANTAAGVLAVERARRSLIQVIKGDLDDRERYIIMNHFGLIGSLVKKQRKTLKQIGQDLDLTKERVRQIELIALQKLRQSLSPEEFELLTG